MQNAGQFGQGAASAHPPSQFVPSEPSPNGGSTTSSLRQFRKKDVDKSHVEQPQPPKQMSESHVARVAPHNHYPPMTNDAYRFSSIHQFSGLNPQMKYSDHLAEASQPNPMSTSVIQKPKTKDYMEMCNVQQQHLNNHQYSPDNGQYMQKDVGQGYPSMYKSESQFFGKDQHHQYQQQMAHQAGPPKFNPMLAQSMRKYSPAPADNPFLNKLSKLHPSMARSIISDHHLQDAQPAYPPMDQRGMYAQQNHRFYPGSMHQSNPYPPNPNYAMNTPHAYPNYSAQSCNYPRQLQMGAASRYPQIERSLSPARRGYPDGMPMHMNYHGMHPKMQSGPNYGQYRGPEYAQHYQHRRGPPQDCFPPSCRPTQYMQSHHQSSGEDMQEIAGNTVSPSDSLKKFIESWIVEEEPANEPNQLDANMNLREKLRDDAPAGTVYMINATDVHYFENNGIPIVTSDNGGFQLTSDNLCLVKGGLIDNSGVVRLIEGGKEIAVDSSENQERVVNLQIMEAPKSDCMVASKQLKPVDETRKVVIHQNTVLNPGTRALQMTDQMPVQQSLEDSLSITKELVDKNCSPINLDHLEENLGFGDEAEPTETERDPTKQVENDQSEELSQNSDDSPYKSPGSKSMPIIDFFGEPPVKDCSEKDDDDNGVKHEVNEDISNDGPSCAQELSSDRRDFEEPQVKEEVADPNSAEEAALSKTKDVDGVSEAEIKTEPTCKDCEEPNEESEPKPPSVEKRKRIFSVDDIMHNIGNSSRQEPQGSTEQLKLIDDFIEKEVQFSSLEQLQSETGPNSIKLELKQELQEENKQQSNILRVKGTSTVLQVAGELMEITVDIVDGKKVIKVKPLSDSTTIIDVNANYEQSSGTQCSDTSGFEDINDEDDKVLIENALKIGETSLNGGEAQVDAAPSSPVAEEALQVESCQQIQENPVTAEDVKLEIELPSSQCGAPEELKTNSDTSDTEAPESDHLLEHSIEPSGEEPPVVAVLNDSSSQVAPACPDSFSVPTGSSAGEIFETTQPDELLEECEKPQNEPNELDCIHSVLESQPNGTLQEPAVESHLVSVGDITDQPNPEEATTDQVIAEDLVQPEEAITGCQDNVFEDQYEDFYDGESLNFPLEDEVFIEEPPAHEVIVSDPLEGIGIIEEIPLEPVTTTELENSIISPELIGISQLVAIDEPSVDDRKAVKLEVQILSPTSTNIEEFSTSQRANVYFKGGRKSSTDNDVSDYTVTTKAAKKLYDYDLQVQHDIVSSSKKEDLPKSKKSALKRSIRLTEKGQAKSDQKEVLKLLVDKRKRREDLRLKEMKQKLEKAPSQAGEPRKKEALDLDEEYVDFKELLRARKLKKLKKMQESNATPSVGLCKSGAEQLKASSDEKSKNPTARPGLTVNVNAKAACLEPRVDTDRTLKPPQHTPTLNPESSRVSSGEECLSSTYGAAAQPSAKPPPPPNGPSSRPNQVLVPSILELMEETNATVSKRKISLADYVSRKRKATSVDGGNAKNAKLEATSVASDEAAKPKSTRTLSDIKTSFVIHSSDWEDSRSPLPAPSKLNEDCHVEDFSGLIKPNSQKPVIDVNELTPLESREDKKLQEYKDKVVSQLSSLNIQIPKVKPQVASSSKSEAFRPPLSGDLVKRFLNNEKLSEKEMEKIRKIISYKRSIQGRKHVRSPSESAAESSFDSSPCSTYEVKNSSRIETDPSEVRLHIKKVNSKRKLSCHEAEEGRKKTPVGYSVINRLGEDGLPKIVFKRHKRNSLAKQPVVELVKLNLDDLVRVQEEYKVTVSQNM